MSDEIGARTRELVKGIAFGSVATVTLFLAYVTFPLVGMLPGCFTPAPGIYIAMKNGRWAGIAIVAVSSGILAVTVDLPAVYVYLLQCGIMTIAIPEFLRRRCGGVRAVIYAVLVNVALIFASAALFAQVTGTDLHAQVIKGVNASIEQTVSLYEKSGIAGDELNSLRRGMQQAGAVIGRIYPALVTLGLGMLACFNLLLLTKVAARFPIPLPVGDFRQYRNPDNLVWLLIAAGFSMLIDSVWVNLAAINILITLAALYSIQGMAIILYFFRKHAVPAALRWLFYLLIAFQPFIMMAVAIVGIFDLWGDFRAPKKQANL